MLITYKNLEYGSTGNAIMFYGVNKNWKLH